MRHRNGLSHFVGECPSCGTRRSETAKFCSYCGYTLSAESVLPELWQPDTKSRASTKDQCNCSSRHLNSQEARFCQFCGFPMFSTGHWASSIDLREGERLVQTWDGIFVGQIQGNKDTFGSRPLIRPRTEQEGLLVLTSQRVFWLTRDASDEHLRAKLAINLEDINDVSTVGGFPPRVSLIDNNGASIFQLYAPTTTAEVDNEDEANAIFIQGSGFLAFKQTVLSYVASRRKEVEASSRPQVVLDFSFLKDYMEKGGLVVQKISCTNCGGKMKLPETGDNTECPYCHTTYHVQDVFERVKELIG